METLEHKSYLREINQESGSKSKILIPNNASS